MNNYANVLSFVMINSSVHCLLVSSLPDIYQRYHSPRLRRGWLVCCCRLIVFLLFSCVEFLHILFCLFFLLLKAKLMNPYIYHYTLITKPGGYLDNHQLTGVGQEFVTNQSTSKLGPLLNHWNVLLKVYLTGWGSLWDLFW